MLACDFYAAGAQAAEELDATQLLEQADAIKSSNQAEFAELLRDLEERSETLAPEQRDYLRYLQGWRSGYDGDYAAALPLLRSLAQDSSDLTVRFRSIATIVNLQAIATQYDEAFEQLGRLLDLLPEIDDPAARDQGWRVTAYVYNQVGEYDLALGYAQKTIETNRAGRGACYGGQLKLEALYRSGRARNAEEFQSAIEACTEVSEPVYANIIRTYIARLNLDQGRFAAAVRLLREHYEEAQRTRYSRLIAEFDALLAQAYRETGDAALVKHHASRAIETGARIRYTEPLATAYRLLYLTAKEQGEVQAALEYHERYAAEDKGYLDDISARQLAYQRVSHDSIASRLEIDALNKENEVLQLQQALDKKAAEASRLYIVLLLLVLASIALWAYRTKRSQLHFMRLSRIDGLTGIANRPHFIDEAERVLEAHRRSGQEVCAVLCDLDHFKSINDRFGHATGDFVLKKTVAACRAHLRSSDLFGRFGGEEFGILLSACSLADARERCEELRIAIAAVATHSGSMISSVSASFGVASTVLSGYELRQLLADADAALYRAKNTGRNRVVLHEPAGGREPPLEHTPPMRDASGA